VACFAGAIHSGRRNVFGPASKVAASATIVLLAAVTLTGCSTDNPHCPLTNAQVAGVVNGSSSLTYQTGSEQHCEYRYSGIDIAEVHILFVPHARSGFRGETTNGNSTFKPISASQAAQLGEPALESVEPPQKSNSPDGIVFIDFNHGGYACTLEVIANPGDFIESTEKRRAFDLAQIFSAEHIPAP
jgi:hypothetical protein